MNTQSTSTSLRTAGYAIQAVDSPKRQFWTGCHQEVFDTIDRVHEPKPACNLCVEWVSWHMSIKGNEWADQAAKAAATASTCSPTSKMKTAQNSSIQFMAKVRWKTNWTNDRENSKAPTEYGVDTLYSPLT